VKLVFEKITSLPRKVHWRILLDLADFAKRESKFAEAKLLFKLITHIQPYAYQGWLEFAKMQEECGRNEAARMILQVGLKFNPLNDNLFVKAIKVEERSRLFDSVRSLLGSLKDEKFDRAWRMILEGALFEGRCGNKESARRAFRYLLRNCQSYGPIYLEASKYEEREGEVDKAIDVCEEGLQYNSKYGPLWFQYLRLLEKRGDSLKKIDGVIN
jgi:tetratricopeptide (TPR) repeat protein